MTNAVAQSPGNGGLSRFSSIGMVDGQLRRGDVIEITIFDTGEEGLFSSTESTSLELGRFTIGQDGVITLPFIGRLEALGSTPVGLQNRIVEGLRGSAVNPQAVVRVLEKPTSVITVNGNVNGAGRFPLTENRERVLDAIALAGGASSEPGAALVTLVRGSNRGSATLDRILADSSQNVYLLPGDQIYVEANASSFSAMGAFKSPGEFEFEAGQLNLAAALGKAGGLSDARNLYIFRNQPAGTPVGVNVVPAGAVSPIIYGVDMTDAANFAYMQQFVIRDGDILYAGD